MYSFSLSLSPSLSFLTFPLYFLISTQNPTQKASLAFFVLLFFKHFIFLCILHSNHQRRYRCVPERLGWYLLYTYFSLPCLRRVSAFLTFQLYKFLSILLLLQGTYAITIIIVVLSKVDPVFTLFSSLILQ